MGFLEKAVFEMRLERREMGHSQRRVQRDHRYRAGSSMETLSTGQSIYIKRARPAPNPEPPSLSDQSSFLPDVSPAKHLACGCRQS